mgnify:CR=1 FL=1
MRLDLNTSVKFIWRGYFKAPDKNWVHMSRKCDSYEIFYVTSGKLYISDDENDYTVNSGEYLITPPCRNQHGWKASSCEFYYFHFYADNYGDDFPMKGIYTDINTIEKYYSMLSHDRSMQGIHNHILAALLIELKNGYRFTKEDSISEVCRSIQTYVKFAPSDKLHISLLAKKFQYSEKYLSQCFKKETGIVLKRYLKNEIMSRAKHMLLYTDFTVGEISEQLGYSDAHSFSHIFKNSEKMSPREYRKSQGYKIGINKILTWDLIE